MPGDDSASKFPSKATFIGKDVVGARWLHIVLLIVGLAGWVTFILACIGGPAWSPDGSQILFAYDDVDNSRTSVALYDRAKGSFRVLLSQPHKENETVALHPRWQQDGKRAMVAIFGGAPDSDDNGCQLVSLPVKSRLPLQVYNLGRTPGCVYAYPQIGDRVYFAQEDLRWVDLKTGEIASRQFKINGEYSRQDEVILSEGKDGLYYQRSLNRKFNASDGTERNEGGREIGVVQTEDPSFKPWFTFWDRDLSALGVESGASDVSPISIAADGRSGAMIVANTDDLSDKILLTEENKGIVRVVDPALGGKRFALGNLVWSADATTLYASALIATDTKDLHEYSLAEIPLDGSRVRLTKISLIHGPTDSDFMDAFRFSMDVTLSPDGHWIAATPAVFGKKELDPADRALFLIDLTDPARRLTKIPIPHQLAESDSEATVSQ